MTNPSKMSIASDFLKSSCRDYEVDGNNQQDTDRLANILTEKFPELNFVEAFEIAKNWTGYENDIKF